MTTNAGSPAAPASAFGDVATVLQLQLDRATGLQGRVEELEGQMALAYQRVRYVHVKTLTRCDLWDSPLELLRSPRQHLQLKRFETRCQELQKPF